jgi:hypothetical protein
MGRRKDMHCRGVIPCSLMEGRLQDDHPHILRNGERTRDEEDRREKREEILRRM